jgi:methionyl-tRNA formyltransferase
MLPEVVWSMPSYGTFNLHASLLPHYRGAAPINWAIINGEIETGVTTFFLQHEIDTGEIIMQETEPIFADDTAGTLYERLMSKGAKLVLETTRLIERGKAIPRKQHIQEPIKHAPKIYRETCQIDWSKSSAEIVNFVRGLSPYPAAWATIQGKTFKIFKVTSDDGNRSSDLSTSGIATDNKSYLCIKSIDGWLSIEELQAEGKRKMTIKEFFAGNKI